MREILFRGKDIAGNWYAGNLAVVKENMHNGAGIIEAGSYISNEYGKPFAYQIRPETVSQFTGLVDRNGKRIFEGDIFTSDYFDDTYNFEVVFSDGAFCGKHKSTGIYMLGFTNYDDNGEEFGYWCEEDYTSHIQIIGNIHDNPELLEAR